MRQLFFYSSASLMRPSVLDPGSFKKKFMGSSGGAHDLSNSVRKIRAPLHNSFLIRKSFLVIANKLKASIL